MGEKCEERRERGVWQFARRGDEDVRQMDEEEDGGGRRSKEPEQGEGQEGGACSKEEKSSRVSKGGLEVGLTLR